MATPAAEPKPLLDLATIDPLDRPFIRIDGKRYDLAVPSDFGLLETFRMLSQMERVTALQARATSDMLTNEDADELARILDAGVAMILRAPAGVRAKLGSNQQLSVIQAFTSASKGTTPKPTMNRRARRSTGASSSRGSRASTRARTS